MQFSYCTLALFIPHLCLNATVIEYVASWVREKLANYQVWSPDVGAMEVPLASYSASAG